VFRRWFRIGLLASTALVASSRTRIFGSTRSARACTRVRPAGSASTCRTPRAPPRTGPARSCSASCEPSPTSPTASAARQPGQAPGAHRSAARGPGAPTLAGGPGRGAGHDHDVRISELAWRVEEINAELERAGIPARVATGGEVAETILGRLDDDELRAVSLGGGGRWILLEPAPGPLSDSIAAAVEHLRERSDTVRRAGGVRDDVVGAGVVGVVVHAEDERHVRLLRGRRDDDLLCSCLEMESSLFCISEEPG
jgi:hypothetical protein